jgi:hypothetical protein
VATVKGPLNPMTDSTNIVDVNTDDLDQFSSAMFGQAKFGEASAPEGNTDEDTNAEDDETQTDEDDSSESNQEVDNEADEASSHAGDSDESDVDDTDEGENLTPEKPKSRAQKRIEQLVKERADAERREDELRARLAEIENRLKPVEPAPKPSSPELAPDAPKITDKNEDGTDKYKLGEFDPQFIRDLTRHTIRQEAEAQRIKDEETAKIRQQEEARKQLETSWNTKIEEAKTRHEDLTEAGRNIQRAFGELNPEYANYLSATIMAMDDGPDVLHYLGTHIEEAKEIVAQGAIKATIALGRIEAKVARTKEPKQIKSSKAPPPPPSTRGVATRQEIADDTDDLDAFSKKLFRGKRL